MRDYHFRSDGHLSFCDFRELDLYCFSFLPLDDAFVRKELNLLFALQYTVIEISHELHRVVRGLRHCKCRLQGPQESAKKSVPP